MFDEVHPQEAAQVKIAADIKSKQNSKRDSEREQSSAL